MPPIVRSTFDLVDLAGEYNYQPNRGAITKDTLPFYTADRVHWYPVEEGDYDASVPSLRFKIKAPSDTFWVAHVPAYTTQNYATLLRDVSKSHNIQETLVGKSVESRPIPLLTITDRSVPDRGKKVIWLMFRQHAWEAGSSWTGDGLIRFVTSSSPIAARIRRETILKILPLCDPDGVVDGGVRFNRHGYDLNRNWDLVDPVKMPEIAAERRAVLDWVDSGKRVDFFPDSAQHGNRRIPERRARSDTDPAPITAASFRSLVRGYDLRRGTSADFHERDHHGG